MATKKMKSLKKKKVPAMPKASDTPYMFNKKAKARKAALDYNAAIDRERERRDEVRESLRR